MRFDTEDIPKILNILQRNNASINFVPPHIWEELKIPEKLFVLAVNNRMLKKGELSSDEVMRAIRSYLYTRNIQNMINKLIAKNILIKNGDRYLSPMAQDIYIIGMKRRSKYDSVIVSLFENKKTYTLRELIEELCKRTKVHMTNTYRIIYGAVISGILTPTIDGLTLDMSK